MTLRFTDSFDHYVTADIAEKWNSIATTPTITAAIGRRSTQAVRINTAGETLTKTLDAAHATLIVGFAFKCSALPVGQREIVTLLDAGSVQVTLDLMADGTLRITRNATTLGTTTFALSIGVFYYIELKALINDSTGTAEVRVDGSSKLALTSQDTKNTANATANGVRLGTSASTPGADWDFDDLYICDGAGSTNNNFLGDCRVDAFAANGNGNSSQLTGSDGNSTDNYLLVDDATTIDDDTTYVEHATVGNKDTYACANMSHTPTSIFGVQVCANAKKDDAGAKSLCTVTRSGGADTDGATQALSTSYTYYREILEQDPNGPIAWTATNFNAAEFGIKVAA